MKCNNGGGGSPSQPVGPSPEQIRQNQLIADARALNQKGLDAFNDGDYDAARDDFQQALDKTPDDPAIQQNLQNTQDKIDARNKFKMEQNEALNELKDASGDAGEGLKGDSDPEEGLKDIHPSDDSASPQKTVKGPRHPASTVNTDPNVVDLRGIPNLTLDPAKLKDMAGAAAGKLAGDPDYPTALEDGIAASRSGSAPDQAAAAAKLRALNDLVVLPEDKDMELLLDPSDQVTFEQILNGIALPNQDGSLNRILLDHPGFKAPLLALWYKTCRQRIKKEDAEMAVSVKKLSAAEKHLGLTDGHIEEATAKDPALKAKWQAAVLNAAMDEESDELTGALQGLDSFNAQARKWVKGAGPGPDR